MFFSFRLSQVLLVIASFSLALSAGAGQSSEAVISSGALMRQRRVAVDSMWPVPDPEQDLEYHYQKGVVMIGDQEGDHSVPIRFCQLHSQDPNRPDFACLSAGSAYGSELERFDRASKWQLVQRTSGKGAYSLKLLSDYADPTGLSDCTVTDGVGTCCLDSRQTPQESMQSGGQACDITKNECQTTNPQPCEVNTSEGDTTQGWTFDSGKLMQRGNCLTRSTKIYRDLVYSLSVQPCADYVDRPLGQRQQWSMHQDIQQDGDWTQVE